MSASDVVFLHDVPPFTSSGVRARVQAPTRCLRCTLRCAHEALVSVVRAVALPQIHQGRYGSLSSQTHCEVSVQAVAHHTDLCIPSYKSQEGESERVREREREERKSE